MSKGKIFDGKKVLLFEQESDRRSFLRWSALVGAGTTLAVGGAVGLPSLAGAAPAPSTQGDLGILNYALTLEYLESDFYQHGIAAGILSGREQELVSAIGSHEKQHVAAVMSAVQGAGGTPVTKPKITYPSGTFGSRAQFLATAAQFEELGVVAYQGQVTLIKSADVLGAAASIAGVESRHAAILESLNKNQPFPTPIEGNKPMSYVLAKVKPFLS